MRLVDLLILAFVFGAVLFVIEAVPMNGRVKHGLIGVLSVGFALWVIVAFIGIIRSGAAL